MVASSEVPVVLAGEGEKRRPSARRGRGKAANEKKEAGAEKPSVGPARAAPVAIEPSAAVAESEAPVSTRPPRKAAAKKPAAPAADAAPAVEKTSPARKPRARKAAPAVES